jgi:MFS family permease
MQFILPLDEEVKTLRHATALHVMLAFLIFGIGVAGVGLFFGFTVMTKNFETHGAYRSFLIFGIGCIVAAIVLLSLSVFQKTWLRRKQNNLIFRIIELLLLVVSSSLFFANGWRMPAVLFGLMSAVVIFAIYRERRAEAGGKVLIEEAGITISNDVRTRKLLWKEVDTVLIRFGILTIECTDNRLIQRNILTGTTNETALIHFCKEQIEAGKAARPVNDW